MLEVDNVSKSFAEHPVLRGVSCAFTPGAVCGLIGPSGSGKSVLLKIIGGVIPQDSGTIRFGAHGRSDMSLMFQEGALFDSISVFDNVAFPLVHGDVPTTHLKRALRLELQERVMSILARVGLSDAAEKVPAQLSGGMRRRVSLARALVSNPDLVLLDDPTCGLDPVASSVIMNLILELQREHRPTMIIVSHDLRRLLPFVDSIHALFDGRVVFTGTLADLEQSLHRELIRFVSCRFDLGGREAAVGAALQ